MIGMIKSLYIGIFAKLGFSELVLQSGVLDSQPLFNAITTL